MLSSKYLYSKPCIRYLENADINSRDEAEFFYRFARSAMIQVFEVTIESSWKIMQRWIRINADSDIHEKPKRELFRTAHQCGLITDPVAWWTFYEVRNRTSHTYHEDVAEEIYVLAKNLANHLDIFINR